MSQDLFAEDKHPYKAGQTWRDKETGEELKIIAVYEDSHLWVIFADEGNPTTFTPQEGFPEAFTLVEPFFEVGKTYKNTEGWEPTDHHYKIIIVEGRHAVARKHIGGMFQEFVALDDRDYRNMIEVTD